LLLSYKFYGDFSIAIAIAVTFAIAIAFAITIAVLSSLPCCNLQTIMFGKLSL